MNNETLAILIKEHMTGIKGGPGRWVGEYEGIPVMVLTDPPHDRMRIMSPVKQMGKEPRREDLQRCMEANFASALDGRYALYNGVLWAVFLHPMSEFRGGRFGSVLSQVTNLAASHGRSYSSGALEFTPKRTGEQD